MKKLRTKMTLMLVLGLLVVGGASAVIVGYLSNTASVEVEVASPTTVQFGIPATTIVGVTAQQAVDIVDIIDPWANELSPMSTTGLSTIEIGLKIVNNADVAIDDEILSVVVSNNNTDVTCADLTSMTFVDVGASEGTSPYQVVQELVGLGLCQNDDGEAIYSIPINSLGAGQTFKYPVTMTFGNVNPATYSFDATMIIDE